MAKKKNAPTAEAQPSEVVNDTIDATRAIEPAQTETAPDTATKRRKPKKAMTVPGATLADVFASYLEALEKDGKSDGTLSSYKMELALAGDELGVETKMADLTAERVVLFFSADRVTKTRSGRAKSPLSIAKTQRV